VQNRQISIFELAAHDSQELSQMLLCGRSGYGQYFHPFSFARDDLNANLSAAEQDRYWGIRCGETLAGFFMLRGWDEGFDRPSFGVYISESFSGRGLSKLALQYALSWCRLNGVSAVMLKVYPDNIHARRVYEQEGFEFLGICPETGHRILEKRLD
jgi:RimJ/RimL family protein N-acetyltransferase